MSPEELRELAGNLIAAAVLWFLFVLLCIDLLRPRR